MEKLLVREGRDFQMASEDSLVTVKISTLVQRDGCPEYHVNQTEDDVRKDVVCGSPDDNSLLNYWLHECIQTMKPGEVSQFRTPPHLCPPNTAGAMSKPGIIGYEIELISLKRGDDVWKWSPEQKLDRAQQLKGRGTDCFKAEQIKAAALSFSGSLRLIISIGEQELNEELSRHRRHLRCICYLNLAACQLKEKLYKHVIENCTKALAIDSHSIKGLFRRGEAHLGVKDYELARQDFTLALSLEPNNRAIKEQVRRLESKERERDSQYRKALGKIFYNTDDL